MARQLYYMVPNSVGAVASGSGNIGGSNYTGPAGDQGHGWSFQGTWTNTQFTTQNPTISIPSNARELSVTYAYNGAATVTFNIAGSNDTVANVLSSAAYFGPFPTAAAGSIVGGTAGSTAATAVISAPPLFLTGVIGGTGAAGADTITITMSCITILRP